MSEHEPVATVQRAYDAFSRGDLQAVSNSMAGDVQWETPDIPGASFGGKRQGKEAVGRFFVELLDAEEMLLFEPREFIAQGNRVVVIGQYRGRVKATGRIAESVFVQIFTVTNGLITNFFEMFDTAKAERAYQHAVAT